MDAPEIFDRRRRATLRNRSAMRSPGGGFLIAHVAAELAEQLAAVDRSFARALFIGPIGFHAAAVLGGRDTECSYRSAGAVEAARLEGTRGEEDRPLGPDGSVDLIIAAGTLDSVADLPGALVLIRRALRPDGLFLGSLFGAGTLPALRRVMRVADGERGVARIHPQVELRQAGDLLQRTGFALPVADGDVLTVRYSELDRLIGDIRDAGVGNCLTGAPVPLRREDHARAHAAWDAVREADGRVTERFAIINLSGWAPSVTQAKPARRGSATTSLAAALRDRS